MLSQEEIERLHNSGKMPDWAYYQQNGKTIQQNYVEQKQKIHDKIKTMETEQQLQETINEAVEDILKTIIDRL